MSTATTVPAIATRLATATDEPFLWQMLTFAASMSGSEDDVRAAKSDPQLRVYVEDFGRLGDLGFIALVDGAAMGAAWLRLGEGKPDPAKVWTTDEPELAIATLPQHRGGKIGSTLMTEILAAARGRYPAIRLSVRETSAAVRLYERFGFVVERRLINRVGSSSLAMRCALTNARSG